MNIATIEKDTKKHDGCWIYSCQRRRQVYKSKEPVLTYAQCAEGAEGKNSILERKQQKGIAFN